MGIIKRAKYPQKPAIIRYKDARPAICAFLSDISRNVNPLTSAETMFNQRKLDPSQSSLMKDDATHSIEVMNALQAMANKLKAYDFHMPPAKQPKLSLGGIEVSVYADLLAHGASKGKELIGAAVLRMTLDDAETEGAKAKRREMGLYVATLARLHVNQNITTNREPANKLCMSIDIQHGEVFLAPESTTQRVNNLENACKIIALVWPTL